ncbi:MAG: pyridoxamine 5'-phosphate oxidase family protein [Pseudomonadota bacterium]
MKPPTKGPWSNQQVQDFLETTTFPLRLAVVGEDGFPRVVSVWYGFDGKTLRCVSHRSSQLVKMLQKSNKVGFEVGPNDPPYQGVRGQGLATLEPDLHGAYLTTMLERYLGGSDSELARWLLSRADGEVLITITPQRLFTWDYTERMG